MTPAGTCYFSDQDLADRYGVSRITPWRWTREGRFALPVKLGQNCTRWPRASVEAWEAERAAELERQVAAGVIPQEHDTATPPVASPQKALSTKVKRRVV